MRSHAEVCRVTRKCHSGQWLLKQQHVVCLTTGDSGPRRSGWTGAWCKKLMAWCVCGLCGNQMAPTCFDQDLFEHFFLTKYIRTKNKKTNEIFVVHIFVYQRAVQVVEVFLGMAHMSVYASTYRWLSLDWHICFSVFSCSRKTPDDMFSNESRLPWLGEHDRKPKALLEARNRTSHRNEEPSSQPGVGFKAFVLVTTNSGEMIQFDEPVFQMAWNHQL